ncbi:O-acyltransferase WSD1 [Bienertia sinuspersici]
MGQLAGGNNRDEAPTTPLTRLSIHPKHNHVILCAIGLKNPIDIAALKDELSNSIMIKIPRFSSLLTVDPHHGTEHWKKTHVNLDDHIFIQHDDDDDDDDGGDAINCYLANMAISSPMSLNKPLWEVHIMHQHKCLILKVHHAVADEQGPEILWDGPVYILFSAVFLFQFLAKCLWAKDKETVISGIEGVEFWPRKVSTASFSIADMKAIRNAIPNVTVNDVLYGIIWCGLTRYLNIRLPKAVQDGVQITGICPVNLREKSGVQDVSTMLLEKSKAPWGNKIGVVLLPITYFQQELNALDYVAQAKEVMDRKKHSTVALLCYNMANLVSNLFGSKIGGDCLYKLSCNTTFFLSNIVGPQEEISIATNPVTFIRVTSSSQPHAITMHMASYAGKGYLQIQVAKEVIPDPEFLARCFEDAFLEMKKDANNCVRCH